MKRILTVLLIAVMAFGFGSSKPMEQPAKGSVSTVNVEQFAKVISQRKVRLIDVRTPKEYAGGHIAGAENIDVKSPDFAERTKKVKGHVAVYCVKGVRSLNAAKQLAEKGCTVYNLDGGLNAWKKAGKPTTTK